MEEISSLVIYSRIVSSPDSPEINMQVSKHLDGRYESTNLFYYESNFGVSVLFAFK